MKPVPCKSCGAPMLWVKTEAGNNMPLDADPKLEGKYMIVDGVGVYMGGKLPGEYVRTGDREKDDGKRYVSHYRTCPNAAKHRKGK